MGEQFPCVDSQAGKKDCIDSGIFTLVGWRRMKPVESIVRSGSICERDVPALEARARIDENLDVWHLELPLKRLLAVFLLVLAVPALAQTTPTITWNTPSPIAYGLVLSATQLDATASVAGTFAYSPSAGTVLTPGQQTLSVTFTPSDTTDYTTATDSVQLTVLATPAPGVISTLAGNGGWGYSGDGAPATGATFESPQGIAVDGAGNFYITDSNTNVIRKVSAATGIITTVAGNGTGGYSGDGGSATAAELWGPSSVAVDAAGNLYIADSYNCVIRKVAAATGIITTIAGTGAIGYTGDGGPATSATFGYDLNVALDGGGNVYVADKFNMVVRKISVATGIITTVAGNGTMGYTGDGGPATGAELNWPYSVAIDPVGNIYVADLDNNVIRKVTASTGIISTVAGNGTSGYTGDGGSALSAELSAPHGVALDAAGNLYIADTNNNVVREISAGTITTVAGNGTQGFSGDGGPAVDAEMDTPWSVGADASGNLYILDQINRRVRIVGATVTEPSKTLPVITWSNPSPITYGTALSGTQLNATANVPGTFTYNPSAGTVLAVGNASLTVVFMPTDNTDYSPAIMTVALTVNQATPSLNWPTPAPIAYGVALGASQLNATANVSGTFAYTPAAGVFFAPGQQTLSMTFTPSDSTNYTSATATVTLTVTVYAGSGIITTIAGDGYYGDTGDGGLSLDAQVGQPWSVAVDSAGNTYVGDIGFDVVRKIEASTGIITTVAGNGTLGYSGDGGLATNAQISRPYGIAVDSSGNLYIAGGNAVRKVAASTGIITTIAGGASNGFSGDGGPATSALLCDVSSVAVDTAGNIYIGDSGDFRVRMIAASTGIINTIAGGAASGGPTDGVPATQVALGWSLDVAVDGSGDVYITDSIANVIRKVTPDGIIHTIVGNGTAGYLGDGGPATSAELNAPNGLRVDSNGNIFIVDTGNNAIREVLSSNGDIATVAGNGILGFSGDGGPAPSAELNQPIDVALDAAGDFFIADQCNDRVRAVGSLTLTVAVTGVSPAAPTLYAPNETLQFTASVSNAVNSAVTWSVSTTVCCSAGSISQTGLYTAPADNNWPFFGPPETVTVTATSVQDPTKSASATLTLMPVIVNPSGGVIYGGFPQQFTPNVPVVWSLGPGAIGTISQTGLYVAPLNGTTSGYFPVVATAQADPNGIADTYILIQSPIVQPVTPAKASLYGEQPETLDVCLATSATNYGCQSNGQTVANWTISPAGAGTISSSGVYTAPALISTEQTVAVTATDVANPAITSTATITLLPAMVSVTPASVTLYPEQTQRFTAVVTNSSNTAVTWSISPAGAGSISSSGVYSSPPTVATEQTVTVTAASQEYPSVAASAVVTLLPAQCPAKAYSYVRPIVIDHTKVPISDQANFPFYFAVTDSLLASTANGGHVTSPAGNDIVFTSDPAGLQPLPFDLEQYNPGTGQIVAWVKVPFLSHAQDTVIYMFYGNSSIALPQQNPTAVWDTSYTAVYQFENFQNGALLDSTINGNNATSNNVQETSGQPGAAGAFDGATSYVTLPTSDFPSYPYANTNVSIFNVSSLTIFNASFAAWFKTSASGVILSQTDGTLPGGDPTIGSVPALYIDTNGNVRANFLDFHNMQQIVSPIAFNDGNWHYAVVTFDTNSVQGTINDGGLALVTTIGTETLYVDGQVIGQQSGAVPDGYNLTYSYYLGAGYAPGWPDTNSSNDNWFYLYGSMDQVEVSSTARSSGWVQAEYNNQSSPSTFFALGSEAGASPSLNPLAVTLYESQSQQFTVLQTGLCSAGNAAWSMPSGSPGILGPTGLYAAPATINMQQTVTVTATTLGATSAPVIATITLMPPVAVTVTPGMAALPPGGTQQFTAVVANAVNTAVTWTLDPVGVGSISPTGLYTAPATLNGQQTVSIIATSVADPAQSASATVTLGAAAPPSSTISISIAPQTALLFAGETQQFIATVSNATNIAVAWSVTPAGVGTIDANGLYTAPSTVSGQQTVTITATSQADATATAVATVALSPAQCASTGYGYVRAITIDHTKIPNIDLTNFPFLFSTTDPLLATTVNGGHVGNPNGYDIIFTSDPAGQNPLNYEMEEYNPTTGQMVAWVQIPDLSHTADTVIYLFYGNSSVTTPQQNPTGTWDSTFQAVWHLPNGTTLSANDSTANANSGTITDVAPTTGQIDGGALFNGSTSQIICGSNVPGFQFSSAQSFTDSAWFNLSTNTNGPMSASPNGYMSILSSSDSGYGHELLIGGAAGIFVVGDNYLESNSNVSLNTWHYIVGVQNGGSGASLYIDGVPVASNQFPFNANSGGTCYIGSRGYIGTENYEAFQGSVDEVRIASVARSADWVAAEYANQSSPSTFFALSSENESGITPSAIALYASQSQQFAAPSICSAGVSWSLSAGAPGSLTSSGLYTAPGAIPTQQTVTVTATSAANSGQSAFATVTLMPPVSVTVSPAGTTLNPNQTQQFAATVNNSVNQAVTWTMSPAGLGSLDQNGGYIAPSSITTQQTVTITATSLTDPTESASAMVTLSPATCASTGYGYQRVIVIDHRKVANTDQINFPVLFNSTDPDLATVDNGGHVASPNGYDIIFSTDPYGQTKLDFEIEQYNPVTGQLVAWIRIPTLSHSSDTILYVFYGNHAITISQADPAGVWDSNYQAVYHLGTLPASGIAPDSTSYANNGSFIDLTAGLGQIDGAAAVNGFTSYLEIPATAFPNYPTGQIGDVDLGKYFGQTDFSATFGIWFNTNSWGGLLDQTSGTTCEFLSGCSYENPGDVPDGSWSSLLGVNFNGDLEASGVSPTAQAYNDGNWHFAVATFANGTADLYADGQLVGTGQGSTYGYSPIYAYFVATVDAESDSSGLDSRLWKFLDGEIDEINVSNTARSGDWIQTQYNNQSSPSTFYKFYSPNALQVAPSSISLYASQSELFAVPGTCDATIAWSIPAGAPGALTSTGLYTAPSVVSSQQTVTVSAVSQSSGSNFSSAQVTLLPAPQPFTLVASNPSPYRVDATQSFTATLLDPQGNPRVGVAVNFTVAGPNETVSSASTGATGAASFTYIGSNSGTDTVQATASVDGALLTSNSLTATWLAPPPALAPTVTLLPQPSPGRGALMGAFTDSNGDLIEPLVIGTTARTFITPAGATRLQLGIDDTYYEDNGGAGFVVAVNGVNITVPPMAMPWKWQTGGLNNDYQYGVNDGSSPVIAAASLRAGQPVTIAYQSGTISTSYPIGAPVNTNGDSTFTTGTQIYQGASFPTLYTTGTAYPQNQPVNVFAAVVDASGAPIPNTPVTLTVSGANPGQYQATTDATGTASFLYTGVHDGNDSLQAQATLAGEGTLDSNLTAIDWTNYPTPPSVGALSLNEAYIIGTTEGFAAYANDASGNVLPNVNVGYYVTGVDNFQTSTTTDDRGEAYFPYLHTDIGTYSVIAVDTVDRNVIVTAPFTNNWTNIPQGTQNAAGGTIAVGITAYTTVTLPNALSLTGTATDSSGATPAVSWTRVSGPGTVTFANPNQLSTAATFSQTGSYVLELTAADSINTGWAHFTVTVLAPSVAAEAQGWIGSPAYGATVSGIVPITLASNVTLASGTLAYAPANNPNNVTVLNANVTGSGQIGALDTTMLANGSYLIQMQGTDANGNSQYSLVLVTATGDYKPGRLTTTVTDLVVPANGLPINIVRSYDSLNAGTSGDFGYGWNLGINVDLTVDPSGNVTFTLGGERKTFYLTPQNPFCYPPVGCILPTYLPVYTPEPGLHGSLVGASDCVFLFPMGSLWSCGEGEQFIPSSYTYTDPTGTQYTINPGGELQSVQDKNGNTLTISANGITSTTGLNVLFVRDSQGRITQITDPQGNIYLYNYDANGNLSSVFYPNTPQPSTYAYEQNHLYLSGIDFRGNPLPSTTYYSSNDTDPNGLPLNGRVKSGTDALSQTRTYTYDLLKQSMTVTYPPDGSGNVGTETWADDGAGDMISHTDPLGNVNTNTYDANRNLISATDALGKTATYTYDSNGNKTSTTYPPTPTSHNTTSYRYYNQYAKPTSSIDELGNVTTYNYDGNYNPQGVTDGLGMVGSSLFNPSGQMVAGAFGYDLTAQPARAFELAYDALGNLASQTDSLGRTTTYSYDALGHMLSMTQPASSSSAGSIAPTTTYQYDAFGNVTQTIAPLNTVTSAQYDGNNNRISSTDARGNTTTYQYDALNRLIKTTYPDQTTTKTSYDFRNNVIDQTDQAENVTHHVYDVAGHQISVTGGYGTSSATTNSFTYDADGRTLTQTDGLGNTTTNTYDAAGRLIATSNAAGMTQYTYDDAGDQVSVTDPDGNPTRYQYDARKRLVTTTFPDSTTVVNTYDTVGNLISVKDQAQNVTQYTFDAANQMVSIIAVNSPDTSNNTTTYAYDGDGNTISVTDENGHTTTYGYDLLSRLVSTTLPDGSLTESRQYDGNGNLTSVQHFNGVTTSFTYDTMNRLLGKTTPSEAPVSFTYKPTGQRASMVDASGTTSYTYDSVNRLTAMATPEGTLNYTYDAAGNLASIESSNPNGAWVNYAYDQTERLSSVTDNRLTGNNTSTYGYDAASNLTSAAYPNGLQSTATYDTRNRLVSLTSPRAAYNYQLGPVGNRVGVTESNGRTENWTYDGIYRLTNESITNDPSQANGNVSYGLDPVGNRLSEVTTLSGLSPGNWGYNADDEASNETYDQNGDAVQSAGESFVYDAENQLVSMNNGAVTFVYDGDGNRVAETANGVTTHYLVDDQNPTGLPQVMDEMTNGAVTRTYSYGLERIDEEQFVSGAWTPSFYGYDGMGSVRQLTSSAGAVTDSYEYDAFGNKVNATGSTPNNYLYRGEQYDANLNMYYLRDRYYNPASGSFLSVDSLAGAGQRRYEYADADPVDGQDPTGDEDIIEYAIATVIAHPTVSFSAAVPCNNLVLSFNVNGSTPASALPPCPAPPQPPPHWTVRVNYRQILSGKFGPNCDATHGIPGCILPLGLFRHSYIEIDGPTDDSEDQHTWGVLGIANNNPNVSGTDQEVVLDRENWDRDPVAGKAGISSLTVKASDQQAQAFEQALNGIVGPPFPDCPSCGKPYHNSITGSPRYHLHWQLFTAFNSNTFTWNAIANFFGVTPGAVPPPISRAPGYHYSSKYAGYP